jgi:hypothetical protein
VLRARSCPRCERNDTECLARKRRLANQRLNAFLTDPLSSPGVLVFAIFLLAGPAAAATRALATLVNPPDDDDQPPPDESPRKRSYGPGLPW